ncbi:MAG: universal stress protein [Thiobacillus sp.]|nr:universal stress protein [Thiobacillus sp.]
MIKLTQEIKRMLNALAFADAGEYLTLRQKTDYLEQTPGARNAIQASTRTPVQPASDRQQVALYMGSELPADMMHYVIQTCSRLKHGLTVLTFQSDVAARALLAPYADELAAAGISMKTVLLTGDPVSGLARYLRRHAEVAFLACKETGYLGRSFLNGTQRQDILPVPVVLVATHEESAQKATPAQPGQADETVRAA